MEPALMTDLRALFGEQVQEQVLLAPYTSARIGGMADATIKMVTESIDAFVKNDVELARAVIAYDDVVDGHFNRIKAALIEALRMHGADGEYALDLLMIAKYLERMGDHAVNIAGWVIYAITGEK